MKSLLYFILINLGIIKKKFKVSRKINFGSQEADSFFVNALEKSKFYLEYGSGSSTIIAEKLKKKFISIETDEKFYNFMSDQMNIKNIKLKKFSFVGDFSTPLLFYVRKYFLKQNAIEYSEDIVNGLVLNNTYPDLILIDGRYRVLCALKLHKTFMELDQFPTIILDDYNDRPYYKVLEKFYEIKIIGRFAILLNPIKSDVSKEVEKYAIDCR